MISHMKKIICKECNKAVANTNNVLARHLRTEHNKEWVNYIVDHEYGGSWPLCECGCGTQLLWKKGGFGRYVKSHENQGSKNPMAKKKEEISLFKKQISSVTYEDFDGGWVPNPWTGQEERMADEIEFLLFKNCSEANDPITKDHDYKIAWEDTKGKIHIYKPNFKNLKQKIIYDLQNFSGIEGQLKLAAVKAWCNKHGFIMLSLSCDDSNNFNVIAWHRAIT